MNLFTLNFQVAYPFKWRLDLFESNNITRHLYSAISLHFVFVKVNEALVESSVVGCVTAVLDDNESSNNV